MPEVDWCFFFYFFFYLFCWSNRFGGWFEEGIFACGCMCCWFGDFVVGEGEGFLGAFGCGAGGDAGASCCWWHFGEMWIIIRGLGLVVELEEMTMVVWIWGLGWRASARQRGWG